MKEKWEWKGKQLSKNEKAEFFLLSEKCTLDLKNDSDPQPCSLPQILLSTCLIKSTLSHVWSVEYATSKFPRSPAAPPV